MLDYTEIADFLQMLIYAFDEYIIFAFVVMVAFAVAMGVKNLLTWGY
jgi:hypothetical protein